MALARCPSLLIRERSRWRLSLVLIALVLSGCASEPRGAGTYIVKRGDTLYSIATKHRLDYRDLARWNGIGRDYVIHPGQILKLGPKVGVSKAAPVAPAPVKRETPRPTGPPIKWQWPVDDGRFTLTTRPNGGQGLTIEGRAGQDIRAASSGRVVYTGNGLLGYGQLVIIKHSEIYLTAYGHTQAVVVREGDQVSAGQRIATMGHGPQGTPMLYFEIRTNGSPGNPLALLPQRR